MRIIEITKDNIDSEHICCAIGSDADNRARALTKKAWMKEQFSRGLRFKRLDERGKVFIEYMPIEAVWKPVVGENYMAVNCLWVSGKFKGQGWAAKLLEECIADARAAGMAGVVAVAGSSVKPFLTDKKFYLKNGFETVDFAEPYFELLAIKFDKNAKNPAFAESAKKGECSFGRENAAEGAPGAASGGMQNAEPNRGFVFVYSCQCVFMEEYVALLKRTAEDMHEHAAVLKLQSREDVLRYGSPFGTLGIYRNGKFLTHELMTEAKFRALIGKTAAAQKDGVL